MSVNYYLSAENQILKVFVMFCKIQIPKISTTKENNNHKIVTYGIPGLIIWIAQLVKTHLWPYLEELLCHSCNRCNSCGPARILMS